MYTLKNSVAHDAVRFSATESISGIVSANVGNSVLMNLLAIGCILSIAYSVMNAIIPAAIIPIIVYCVIFFNFFAAIFFCSSL